jgi:exopolysaccharide biosynthesis predicted pyruvyltransferase EpsI
MRGEVNAALIGRPQIVIPSSVDATQNVWQLHKVRYGHLVNMVDEVTMDKSRV